MNDLFDDSDNLRCEKRTAKECVRRNFARFALAVIRREYSIAAFNSCMPEERAILRLTGECLRICREARLKKEERSDD